MVKGHEQTVQRKSKIEIHTQQVVPSYSYIVTSRYHFHPYDWQKLKCLTGPSVGGKCILIYF